MPVIGISRAGVNARLLHHAALILGLDLRRIGPAEPSASFLAELDSPPDLGIADEGLGVVPDGLVVLLARSPHGQVVVYPVTSAEGDLFIAPASIPDEMAVELQQRAISAIDDRIGMHAVCFSPNGEQLGLVSGLTLAGLWTLDAARTSQFEQHLRALLDLPLGSPELLATHVVTEVVLGGDKPELFRPFLHLFARDPALRVCLYGVDVVPGARIGHVTVLGEGVDRLRDRVRHAAGYLNGEIEE